MILNKIDVPSFKDSTIVRKGVIDSDTNQSSILEQCDKFKFKKWLEPAVEINIENIINNNCELNELYHNFMRKLEEINNVEGKVTLIKAELENLFLISTRRNVTLAYKEGFNDGLEIGRQLK